ncbi:MAG: ATP-binding cassette domain-containing protein [Chloroflexi bacterium]|nr:ATP-binding cassette domain-containing protein [Chloroflexota bacterium]
MATTAIQVENISKRYGDFQAVQALSFEVFQGELFAVLGPNGSGKTTTMRMILDILKPDSGRIAVLGGPLTEATKDRIGYLPEERGLYRNARVLEMMVYLAQLKGLSGAEAKKRSLALLERLQLAEHAKKKVSELSKGMQQKVQFAVTVLHNPQLIIIDEPFSGLDPVNSLVLKDLLLELRQQGVAIVMSTHQMYQVEEMADRLLMIHKGQLQLYGKVDEIRNRYAVHALVVEGQGDWSKLPGVARVENSENGRSAAMLYLSKEATADSVLAAIAAAPDIRIQRFELAVPGLNDIFIRVVEEHGQ